MRTTLFLLTAALLLGCSNLPSHREAILRHDATVWISGVGPVNKLAGETFSVDADGALVTAPGRVGVMIVGVGRERIEVEAKPLDATNTDSFEQRLNKIMADVLADVNEIQALMRLGHNEEALAKTDELLKRHPHATYLNLLRASALTVLGRRDEAKAALDLVLKDFPSNISARGLYSRLSDPEE